MPKARRAHTICRYRNSIVLYGGSGLFMPDIGLREAFNDMWLWDTQSKTQEWRQILFQGMIPKKRIYHASACIGGLMLVFGGVNTETGNVLDDYNIFDFISETWLKVRTVKAQNGEKFKPQCNYENNLAR